MPALEEELVRDVRELPPRRDVAGRPLPGDLLDEADALVEHGRLLLARHRDRVLVGVAVDPDLVTARDDLLGLRREGLDRVAGDEPRRLQVVAVEELQEARRSDLAGEEPAGDVVGRVLASVRPEPAGHRVDVDPVRDEDLLGHSRLPPEIVVGRSSHVRALRCPPERALGRRGRWTPGAGDPDGAARTACSRGSGSACASGPGSTSSPTARALARSPTISRASGRRPSGSPGRPLDPLDAGARGGARAVKTPVSIVTGYLGSGKTTLISRCSRIRSWVRRR